MLLEMKIQKKSLLYPYAPDEPHANAQPNCVP
jgi:hypothetical protein